MSEGFLVQVQVLNELKHSLHFDHQMIHLRPDLVAALVQLLNPSRPQCQKVHQLHNCICTCLLLLPFLLILLHHLLPLPLNMISSHCRNHHVNPNVLPLLIRYLHLFSPLYLPYHLLLLQAPLHLPHRLYLINH